MEGLCRVCLGEDRKTYRIANTDLEQTYDVVTSVKLQRADRPTALCCVCVSQLRRCRRFIETARESNDALDRWYTHIGCKLTERPLLSFNKTPTECVDICGQQLKQELEIEIDGANQVVEKSFIKCEVTDNFQYDPLNISHEGNDNTQTFYNDHKKSEMSDDDQDNTLMSITIRDIAEMSNVKQDTAEMSDVKRDITEMSDIKQNITEVSDVKRDITELSIIKQDITELSDVKQDTTQMSDYNPQKSDKVSDSKNNCRSVKRNVSRVLKNVKKVDKKNRVDVKNKKMQESNDVKLDISKDLYNASTINRSRKRIKLNQNTNCNIKDGDKATIVALHKDGRNISQISNATGFTRKTVRRWIKRFKEEGSLNNRLRSGRPPIINKLLRNFMLEQYEQNSCIPQQHFAEIFYTSVDTVRRALHSEGIHHKTPANKPFLSQRHKSDRVRFARQYIDFDWGSTVFCVEKTLISNSNGKITLWRSNNCCSVEKNTIPNTEPGSVTLNMWGWISTQGPGELEFINSRANNGSDYVNILNDVMLPTARTVFPKKDFSKINLVHENCSIHRTRVVREWFNQHPDIKPIPWPAHSPDLNPFEDLWAYMVQRWEARDERSHEQLESHCLKIWESLRGTDVCAGIVASVRRRLQSCIDNDGGHIQLPTT